jgi:hypothetical protein
MDMTLPPNEAERVALLRDELLDAVTSAVDDLAPELAADTERAIERIAASGYKRSVIKKQVAMLMAAHYGRVSSAIGSLIEQATGLNARYRSLVDKRIASEVTGRPVRVFSSSEAAHIVRSAKATVRQALSGQAARSIRDMPATTPAGRAMAQHVKPWSKAYSLSKRLHPRQVAASKEITRNVVASISESRQLQMASSDLIRAVRASGAGEVAKGGAKISKLMRRFESAGKALAERGSPVDVAEWNATRAQIKKYIPRLAEGGRVRMNLLELLQKTEDGASMLKKAKPHKVTYHSKYYQKLITKTVKGRPVNERVDAIMRHHAADKQRASAETIIQTETAVAQKESQIAEDEASGFVVGYIWRLMRAERKLFEKRVKPNRRFKILGKRGRKRTRRGRCICEYLDGKRISIEEAKRRPIGHPNCMCWLEPVFSDKAMTVAGDEWGD